MSKIALPKAFQLRETFCGERFLITKVSDEFCFYLYSNGITCMCRKHEMIEPVVKQFPDFLSAIKSPEFKLAI